MHDEIKYFFASFYMRIENPQEVRSVAWEKKPWEGSFDFEIVTKNKGRREACLAYFGYLRGIVSNRENWIGEGGAARVFHMGNSGLCVKVMKNRHESEQSHMYDLGNTVQAEMAFLRDLSDFEIDGVRTPEPVEYLHGRDTGAIVMEELDAVDMQRVINGDQVLPENFDFEDFFERLRIFLDGMHIEKSICHGDVYPKNIMIDQSSGMPRVIDFGRSVRTRSFSREERSCAEKNDWKQYEETKDQMRRFLLR